MTAKVPVATTVISLASLHPTRHQQLGDDVSGDHEAIAEELTGVLEAVRELHKPEEMENIVRLVRGIATLVIECHGCEPNFSDWGMDYQGWPCSTARIVYTQAEIEKALEGA